MMDKEIKAKWLELLRSGEINQTQYKMKRAIGRDAKGRLVYGYCCLGVLAEFVLEVEFCAANGVGDYAYPVTRGDCTENSLTDNGREWTGLSRVDMNALTHLNDGIADDYNPDGSKHSFEQIADWIEDHL